MSEMARAKINLTLHVGRARQAGRFKGYHPLDSLVVFADFGDRLSFQPSLTARFEIVGPFSRGLEGGADNLVLRALKACDVGPQSITLEKNIPVSAGLGGGSANAAAVLRSFDPNSSVDDAEMGADIPVCRLSQTSLMTGIGDKLAVVPDKGQIAALLVNPRIAVSTAEIFHAFDARPQAEYPAASQCSDSLIECALAGQNDLEPVAVSLAPVISDALASLKDTENCQLSRMSGSGATCYGLYPDTKYAEEAAQKLQHDHPNWWVKTCLLGDPINSKAPS